MKKFSDEILEELCKEHGLKFIERLEGRSFLVKLSCGHNKVVANSPTIKKISRCYDCIEERIKQEAVEQGIIYNGPALSDDRTKRNYTLSCGCSKDIRYSCIPKGAFKCQVCTLSRDEYLKEYRKNNKDYIRELHKKWREANKECLSLKSKQKYLDNREYFRKKGKKHYDLNKAKYLHWAKLRKEHIKLATPHWLSKDCIESIKDIYVRCKNISDTTGIKHHVDHIIPLRGELVCGLHVPWNLRIIEATENLTKSNTFDVEAQ